jgi:hypothetical protein
MKQLKSLLWKEWHAARPFLWIGLGLFLGLPAIGGVEDVLANAGHHFELSTAPWVAMLGGVLAVFVAVGVTTPDLRPKVADFWRSRPVSVVPWLWAKYGVALAVVLVTCAGSLVAEMAWGRHPDSADGVNLAFLPFFWTAAFSLAFLAACLVDRPAHAAVVGLSLLLLAYVLPVVVPPLAWLSVTDLSDTFVEHKWNNSHVHLLGVRQAVYVAGMLAVSAVAMTGAIVGVRRGWRVESGRKLLWGVVAAAVLVLFASAAFQLGSNLPVLAEIRLPANEAVSNVAEVEPGRYVTVSDDADWSTHWKLGDNPPPHHYRYRELRVEATGLALGRLIPASSDEAMGRAFLAPGVPRDRGFAYYINDELVPGKPDWRDVSLVVTDLLDGRVVRSIPLWRAEAGHEGSWARLRAWDGRLFLDGNSRLRVYDIVTPGQLRVASDEPFRESDWWHATTLRDGRVQFALMPLPGVPPVGRLRATVRYSGWGSFDGQTLCERPDTKDESLLAYRVVDLTDRTATFEKVGEYRPTLLQRFANSVSKGNIHVTDGLAFVNGYGTPSFNDSISVLETRGPRPMREVGHFAAPDARAFLPLPDGRAIVGGGNKLWLVGAPKRS